MKGLGLYQNLRNYSYLCENIWFFFLLNPNEDWEFKDMPLATAQGMWMNLDVSPDGKQIDFDFLGEI